jgi:hypothetical protein
MMELERKMMGRAVEAITIRCDHSLLELLAFIPLLGADGLFVCVWRFLIPFSMSAKAE